MRRILEASGEIVQGDHLIARFRLRQRLFQRQHRLERRQIDGLGHVMIETGPYYLLKKSAEMLGVDIRANSGLVGV